MENETRLDCRTWRNGSSDYASRLYDFGSEKLHFEEYQTKYYEEFLEYIRSKYEGQYWHVLPKDIAMFCLIIFRPK